MPKVIDCLCKSPHTKYFYFMQHCYFTTEQHRASLCLGVAQDIHLEEHSMLQHSRQCKSLEFSFILWHLICYALPLASHFFILLALSLSSLSFLNQCVCVSLSLSPSLFFLVSHSLCLCLCPSHSRSYSLSVCYRNA